MVGNGKGFGPKENPWYNLVCMIEYQLFYQVDVWGDGSTMCRNDFTGKNQYNCPATFTKFHDSSTNGDGRGEHRSFSQCVWVW